MSHLTKAELASTFLAWLFNHDENCTFKNQSPMKHLRSLVFVTITKYCTVKTYCDYWANEGSQDITFFNTLILLGILASNFYRQVRQWSIPMWISTSALYGPWAWSCWEIRTPSNGASLAALLPIASEKTVFQKLQLHLFKWCSVAPRARTNQDCCA